tara:strand:- start:389 stop:1336 length:948 start_codon:yes stop_codon:yes gene_type:complete
MLTTAIEDQRGWNAISVDATEQWHVELSAEFRAACTSFASEVESSGAKLVEWIVPNDLRWIFAEYLKEVREQLDTGRGFVIIDRIAVESCSLLQAQAMYWLVGQGLGQPVAQNIQGALLYDVRDTGQNVQQGARFSVTNAESTFHTDCAFNREMPDYVGLLCINGAKSGGQSQLVSAYALHNNLLFQGEGCLAALYRPFCFDRRGQYGAGELPYSHFPVYSWNGAELTMRYMHYYIQVGQAEAGEELDGERARALLEIERLVSQPEYHVEFSLKPGQMLFTNNHWILHNRTAFADHEEVDRRRHYVRLWLDRTHL